MIRDSESRKVLVSEGYNITNDGDVFYTGNDLSVLRAAGDYTFRLIVTDEYGASDSAEIVVGVEAEHNEGQSKCESCPTQNGDDPSH